MVVRTSAHSQKDEKQLRHPSPSSHTATDFAWARNTGPAGTGWAVFVGTVVGGSGGCFGRVGCRWVC